MTLFIAIWGAVIGTLTFFWNFLKWWQENPRISATIEAVESFWTDNSAAGIRMILRNRGGKRTTVERIFFYRRERWLESGVTGELLRLRGDVPWRFDAGASNPKTVKLPKILDANDVWEGFIPLEAGEPDDEEEQRQLQINREIAKVLHSGELRYSIVCAHTTRRKRGLVRYEDNSVTKI